MQACDLIIFSAADGEEKTYTLSGNIEISPHFVRLRYTDEGAKVCVEADENGVLVRRTGDYTLRLPLRLGERTTGAIGLFDTEGRVDIFTDKLIRTLVDDCFSLHAEYALIFGGEEQKMKLRLKANLKKEI